MRSVVNDTEWDPDTSRGRRSRGRDEWVRN